MPRDVAWKLVVDETGSVKRMELFGKEAEKVDRQMAKTKRSAREAESGIRSLGGAFGGLTGAMKMAMGVGAGFGLANIVSKTGELAHETDKFSAISGLGARNSLYYVAALKARGVNSEAFGKALARLSRTMQTAERQQYSYTLAQDKAHAKGRVYTGLLGVQAGAFQELGLNLGQLTRMKPDERLEKVIRAVSQLSDPLKKSRIEMQLFGRGGAQFADVLNMGALGLLHQTQQAERFFPMLKGGKVTMDQLINSQAEAKMAWEGLEFTLGLEVAPALSKVMGAFSGVIDEMEHGQGIFGTVDHLFKDVAKGIEQVDSFLGIGKKGHWTTRNGKREWAAGSREGLSDIETLIAAWAGGGLAAAGAKKAGGAAAAGARRAGSDLLSRLLKGGEAAAGGALASRAGAAFRLARRVGGRVALPLAVAEAGMHGEGALFEKMLGERMPKNLFELVGGVNEKTDEGEASIKRLNAYNRLHHTQAATPAAMPMLQPAPSIQNHVDLYVDGRKIAEALSLNPNAVRYLAEGVERSAHSRVARR